MAVQAINLKTVDRQIDSIMNEIKGQISSQDLDLGNSKASASEEKISRMMRESVSLQKGERS